MIKLCVIIGCYNKHHVVDNLNNFLLNIIKQDNFDVYMVNNDINNHEKIKSKYESKYIVVEGDNTQYEFSGIQKCIEMLREKKLISKYNIFLLGTDALFNHPIYYFDLLNRDIFDYVIKNNVCIGNIDTFGDNYAFDDFKLKHWLRSSLIFINSVLFRKINYKFLTYDINKIYDGDKLTLHLSDYLYKFLNNWLINDRYKYLNDDNKKKIKLSCIYNEWKFTNKIEKYGKIIDFSIMYYGNYVDEIMTKHNESVLINTNNYIKKVELDDILNIGVEKQIFLKHKIIN